MTPNPSVRSFGLSAVQVQEVLNKTQPGNYSQEEIRNAKYWINNALFYFEADMAEATSLTEKQLLRQAHTFFTALERFLECAPNILKSKRPPLFLEIAQAGERFAAQTGQDIYFPARVYDPQHRDPNAKRDAGPPMPDRFAFFRSDEKLHAFLAHGEDIARWRYHVTIKMRPGRSPAERLVVDILPDAFQRIFGRKLGVGREGPGIRFILEILKRADIRTHQGTAYSLETVVAWLSRGRRRRRRMVDEKAKLSHS